MCRTDFNEPSERTDRIQTQLKTGQKEAERNLFFKIIIIIITFFFFYKSFEELEIRNQQLTFLISCDYWRRGAIVHWSLELNEGLTNQFG